VQCRPGTVQESLVLPTYSVEPVIDVDDADLKVLTPYQVVNGFAVVRDYEPLIDIRWDEARECVEAEGRWLRRAMAAEDAAEFDEILGNAPRAQQRPRRAGVEGRRQAPQMVPVPPLGRNGARG
jgi:hypothetical protein